MSVLFLSLALLTETVSDANGIEAAEDAAAVRTVDLVVEAEQRGEPPLLNVCTKGNVWAYLNIERLRTIPLIAESLDAAEQSVAKSSASRDALFSDLSLSEWGLTTSNVDWIAATGAIQLRYDVARELGDRSSFKYVFTSWATAFHDPVNWNALGEAVDDAFFKKLLGVTRLLVPSEKRSVYLKAIRSGTTPTCLAGLASAKKKTKDDDAAAKRGRELFESTPNALAGDDYTQLLSECVTSLVAFVYVCDPETDTAKIVDIDELMGATEILACRIDAGESAGDLVLRLDLVPRDDVSVAELGELVSSFVASNVKAEVLPPQALAALEAGELTLGPERVRWTVLMPGVLAAR